MKENRAEFDLKGAFVVKLNKMMGKEMRKFLSAAGRRKFIRFEIEK